MASTLHSSLGPRFVSLLISLLYTPAKHLPDGPPCQLLLSHENNSLTCLTCQRYRLRSSPSCLGCEHFSKKQYLKYCSYRRQKVCRSSHVGAIRKPRPLPFVKSQGAWHLNVAFDTKHTIGVQSPLLHVQQLEPEHRRFCVNVGV